jgi:hypothetical protein
VIECGEFHAMKASDVQKGCIGDLLMSNDSRNQRVERRCGYGWSQINELVIRMGHQARKQGHGSLAIQGDANNSGIQRKPKKSDLGQKAGGPSCRGSGSKPGMGGMVMRMIGPRQTEEQIHIRQ